MDSLAILCDGAPTKLETCIFQFIKFPFLSNLLHDFLNFLPSAPNQIIHMADRQSLNFSIVLEHDIGGIFMWNAPEQKLQHGLVERTPKTTRCVFGPIHWLSCNQKRSVQA